MHYLTARKRAEGLGSARHGTLRHIFMTASGWALLFIVPIWVVIVGRAIGGSLEEVRATFGHPFVAIVTALFLVVGLRHFATGARTAIEDYARGLARAALIMLANALAYLTIAAGLYALVRLAL